MICLMLRIRIYIRNVLSCLMKKIRLVPLNIILFGIKATQQKNRRFRQYVTFGGTSKKDEN